MGLGLDDSIKFHSHKAWKYPGAAPGVNTLSELTRAVSSIALILLNAIAAPVYLLIGCFTGNLRVVGKCTSCIQAIGYNAAMLPYSLFAAIPFFGNIPTWKGYKFAKKLGDDFSA